jgi:hypothetical protein
VVLAHGVVGWTRCPTRQDGPGETVATIRGVLIG